MKLDPRYLRPTGVELLKADPSNVKPQLGWEAQVRFTDLVGIMVDTDLKAAGLPGYGEMKPMLDDVSLNWLKKA